MSEIKALLVKNRIKQVEIARNLNVSEATVSRVVSRKERSRRVQKEIARVLNLTYEELWNEKLIFG